MKKRLLAIVTAMAMVLTMIPAMAFAEATSPDGTQVVKIDAENFPDPNFRSEVKERVGSYLSESEVADTTELYMYDCGIADLTGIEYFTDLEELGVGSNELTSLDVSILPKLRYLDCYENNLTELNIDGLVNLETLYCWSNQLTELNVEEFVNLQTLECGDNQLTSLDLSALDKLYYFTAPNNQLTELIISAKAPFYSEEYSEEFDVRFNNFQSLKDIQFNGNEVEYSWRMEFHPQNWAKPVEISEVNFPDPAFREMLAGEYNDDNQDGVLDVDELTELTYIDSYESMIEDLTGIEHLFALSTLQITDSYLTELPELPAGLKYLWVSGNYLTELPELPEGLIELSCGGNQLTALPALPDSLDRLNCWENKLTVLPALPAGLTYLDCDDNQLTKLPALPASLEELYCSENKIGSLPALPSKLTILSCSYNGLKTLPALPASLAELRCQENQITVLPSLPLKLQYLNADDNEIGGVIDLSQQKYLTSVHLSDNRITGVVLNPMAKYETVSVYKNAMKSTADVTGRSGIVWEEDGYWFDYQKTACELNGHKYKLKKQKASFSSSGYEEQVCSVCKHGNYDTYKYYGYVKKPKNITKAYSGSVLAAPKFVVKTSDGKTLKQGTDYTVKKVTSNKLKNVGKYKYKITLKGAKYSGSTFAYVTVNPKATTIKSVTKGKKQFTVKWNKRTAQVTGYQIRYSTNAKFTNYKTITVKGAKNTSKTIKNLKAKKKYYVKVRTYKVANDVKYFSAWSKARYVTTK